MKVTIDIPENDLLQMAKEYFSSSLLDECFDGEKYNDAIDFLLKEVDNTKFEDNFDAKKQIIADVISALILKMGITKERVDLCEGGYFSLTELANILDQADGHYVWLASGEAKNLFDALDSYITEGYEPLPEIFNKVSKALDPEYFKAFITE